MPRVKTMKQVLTEGLPAALRASAGVIGRTGFAGHSRENLRLASQIASGGRAEIDLRWCEYRYIAMRCSSFDSSAKSSMAMRGSAW